MSAALHQSWPPFVLIAGLLLIGLLANRDGLFAWGGARLQGLPGGGLALLGAALERAQGADAHEPIPA